MLIFICGTIHESFHCVHHETSFRPHVFTAVQFVLLFVPFILFHCICKININSFLLWSHFQKSGKGPKIDYVLNTKKPFLRRIIQMMYMFPKSMGILAQKIYICAAAEEKWWLAVKQVANVFHHMKTLSIPHICHGSHGYIRVNFFLPVQIFTDLTQKIGVFHRFNAKNWRFSV